MTYYSGMTHPVSRHLVRECESRAARATISNTIASLFVRLSPANFSKALKQWRRNRINRAAATRLRTLDDHMLDDIGLTRHDVDHALGLPLSRNAAEELEAIARWRKDNARRGRRV